MPVLTAADRRLEDDSSMKNTGAGSAIVWMILMLGAVQLGVAAAGAEESPLGHMLATIARQKSAVTPLKAVGSIEIGAATAHTTDQITIVAGVGDAPPMLVALENARARVLVDADRKLHVAVNGDVAAATPATPLAETRLTIEDLLPFDPARCMGVHVVDDLPEAMTLRCDPKAGAATQYSLTVWKFDRERGVPLQVLFYKKTLSNLVKRMKADDYVQIGEKWRPRRIVVQDFEIGAKDVLELEWQGAAAVDGKLFDAKSFAEAGLGP